jgi:hypothetical protein
MSKELQTRIENERLQYNANMVCLMKKENFQALAKAKREHDYCAIQKIFEGCDVPRDQWQNLIDEIMHCPRAPW